MGLVRPLESIIAAIVLGLWGNIHHYNPYHKGNRVLRGIFSFTSLFLFKLCHSNWESFGYRSRSTQFSGVRTSWLSGQNGNFKIGLDLDLS